MRLRIKNRRDGFSAIVVNAARASTSVRQIAGVS
jgi:hypothetical protein